MHRHDQAPIIQTDQLKEIFEISDKLMFAVSLTF